MKKNNVAIDVISFGSDESSVDMSIPSVNGEASSSTSTSETNESKLLALHEAVNSSENSHFLHVEPGPHLLSERISASAILRGEGAGDAEMGDMGGAGGDEYGVDPNLDPELAMVNAGMRVALGAVLTKRSPGLTHVTGRGASPSSSCIWIIISTGCWDVP